MKDTNARMPLSMAVMTLAGDDYGDDGDIALLDETVHTSCTLKSADGSLYDAGMRGSLTAPPR